MGSTCSVSKSGATQLEKRKLFSANVMFKSVHEKIKDHQYEHCEMAFSSSRNLKRHKNIHSDIWDLVKCSMWWSICDKTSLKIHTKVAHEKLKDHQCEHCEKSFSSKWCFKIHKMTHSDIQERIKCSKCKKKLAHPKGLWKFTLILFMTRSRTINVKTAINLSMLKLI